MCSTSHLSQLKRHPEPELCEGLRGAKDPAEVTHNVPTGVCVFT